MALFNDADKETLLAQPGYFFYRAYGSSGSWTKAVFANGAKYTPAVESTDIAFDDVGDVYSQVSKETCEIAISSGRVLDFDFIQDITGGLYTKEVVAGTPVTGATQTIPAGWGYSQISLFAHQMGNGASPTVTSVVGSVDGALVAGTDYDVVKLPEVGWGIAVNDTTTVTTLAQSILVTYNYTPNSMVTLKRGGIKIMTPIEIAFQTVTSEGDYVQYFFYKCSSSGSDGHGFGQEGSASVITMDITFSAKQDKNRQVGDQLLSKVIGGTSLG